MDFELSNGLHLKQIRLRLGWSSAELARRLSLTITQTLSLESNPEALSPELKAICADLFRYAEDYSRMIARDPFAEKVMTSQRLSQITGSILFQLQEKDFKE